MQLADFPLLLSAFENYRNWRGEQQEAHGARRIKSLQNAIATLNQALEAGEIANKTFVDTKQDVRYLFEEGYQSFVEITPVLKALRNRPYEDTVRDLLDGSYGSYPEPHTLAGKIKKAAKLPQNDPAVTIGTAFFKEIAPLADALQFLKDKVVKRQPKTEEQKEAEKFFVPPSSSKAVARVQTMLEEIVDAEYQRLLLSFTKQFNDLFDSFFAKQAEADKDPSLNGPKWRNARLGTPVEYKEYYSIERHVGFEHDGRWMVDGFEVGLLADSTKNTYEKGVYRVQPRPDAREILAAKAEKEAKNIRAMFVAKNLRKIVSILEAKGDDQFAEAKVISRHVSLSGLEGEIRFTFHDGSGFDVNNKVVYVRNSYGTRFYRFPLTFHNVKLPGGAKMASPSEKRMNTVFLGK